MRTVGDREPVIHEQVRVLREGGDGTSGRLPPHPRESASSPPSKTTPSGRSSIAFLAASPIQSSANATARPPKAVDKASAICRKLNSGLANPSGSQDGKSRRPGRLCRSTLARSARSGQPRTVRNKAILHRHVQVSAHENATPPAFYFIQRLKHLTSRISRFDYLIRPPAAIHRLDFRTFFTT